MSFLRLSVNDLSRWFHWAADNGFTAISELDCKEQFNNIPPDTVHEHLQASSKWLIAKRRWGAKDLVWFGTPHAQQSGQSRKQ